MQLCDCITCVEGGSKPHKARICVEDGRTVLYFFDSLDKPMCRQEFENNEEATKFARKYLPAELIFVQFGMVELQTYA